MNSGNGWREKLLDTVERWEIWREALATLWPRWRVDLRCVFRRPRP